MKLVSIALIAMCGLFTNKLRSALTMLGVIIGVAAVIVMLSIGRSTRNAIGTELQKLGTNLLLVLPGDTSVAGIRGEASIAGTLTLEDAYALADPINVPAVLAVAPMWNTTGQVVYRGKNIHTRILGVTPEFEQVRNSPVEAGEFIQHDHVGGRSNVILLGSVVVDRLFADEEPLEPLGKWIRLNNVPFRVIGILESKGAVGLVDMDDVVYVPITTAQTRLVGGSSYRGANTITGINVQVISEDQIDEAVEQISTVLRRRHHILYDDDFAIVGQNELLNTANQIIDAFTFFLGGVAAISLIVGGIGIMNIMLVSVTERTKEIGIRKAVGATRGDILVQFLFEAVTLAVVGGLGGILLGFSIVSVLSGINVAGYALDTVVGLDAITLAVGFSIVVGVVFGLYPARRAARLNPIDALRYE